MIEKRPSRGVLDLGGDWSQVRPRSYQMGRGNGRALAAAAAGACFRTSRGDEGEKEPRD